MLFNDSGIRNVFCFSKVPKNTLNFKFVNKNHVKKLSYGLFSNIRANIFLRYLAGIAYIAAYVWFNHLIRQNCRTS